MQQVNGLLAHQPGAARLVLALSLPLAVAGCDVAAPVDPADSISVSVFSEFLDYRVVEQTIPALAKWDTSLTLAVPPDRIADPQLTSLLRHAEAAGVEVRIWPVLHVDDGYWANEQNVDLFVEQMGRLSDWLKAEHLGMTVLYNLEPSVTYRDQIIDALKGGIGTITGLMQAHLDPAAFDSARARLTRSVLNVQSQGLRAACVTYPQVVDDVLDGDDDIQDALDIPVRGVPFDEVGFMVYQTSFGVGVGSWIGPGLVRAFAADAKAEFGDRAAIALGTVGAAGRFHPPGPIYADPQDLAQDIAAARAEGIARVEIYSLDGMMMLGGPDRWLTATTAEPNRAAVSILTSIVRIAAIYVDQVLAFDDREPPNEVPDKADAPPTKAGAFPHVR